jgi:hypothetical protein
MVLVEVDVIRITLPYDPVWKPLPWAKKYCSSYITNDVHCDGYNTYDNSRIDYFFGNEEEATMFALRWA